MVARLSVLSLCSGYGGLEMALGRLTDTRIVSFCDNYRPAAKVLGSHFPEVPVSGDVKDPSLRGLVADAVTFGFPCQDLSVAGKGAGLEGSRSRLFFSCMDVVRAVSPSMVVVENVPGLRRYREVVDRHFLDVGLTANWATVRACEAGLPHRRERVVIVALRDGYSPTLGEVQEDLVEPTFPTPTVMDMGWGRSAMEWNSWVDTQRERHGNGNGHGRSLYQLCGEGTLMVMEHLMGLPTGYITCQGLTEGAQRRLLGNGVAPAQVALGIQRALGG